MYTVLFSSFEKKDISRRQGLLIPYIFAKKIREKRRKKGTCEGNCQTQVGKEKPFS